jgi:hypothetical protein
MPKNDDDFMSFEDVGVNKIDDNKRESKEKDFLKGANMTPTKSKPKNKAGRKRKDVKAEITKVVYFNNTQSIAIDEYCNSIPVPFSTLVKQLLHKEGILN